MPKLDCVLAGNVVAAKRLPMFGTDAADSVESVGDGASLALPGGADDLPRRWWIVPSAGDVLISVCGLFVGVASARTDSVELPRGLGVMKLPGLLGGGGEVGSKFRGVMASGEGAGRGGSGGDEPYG